MALIVSNKDAAGLEPQTREHAYCILDSCLTAGIHAVLADEMIDRPGAQLVYNFERAMQNVAMQMQLRGTRVDEAMCDTACWILQRGIDRVNRILGAYGTRTWGKPINFQNNHFKHLPVLFYDHLGVPVIKNREKRRTANREALEKIRDTSKQPVVRQIARAILLGRDYKKQLDVLLSKRDSRGRFRSSFNVGATETGRWSSSKNCFGEGNNMQNVTPARRGVFIPDEGWKMGNADLKQAESLVVAHLCGDVKYIEAHESGDTHTYVARLIWPEVPWTGDMKEDRKLADMGFYRHFSRRDLSKRVQHGSNYGMSEYLLARLLKIDVKFAREIQQRYFSAFTGIRQYHMDVRADLRKYGEITTVLGRPRQFFERLHDEHTVREAIAFEPQSVVADILNCGLYNLWERYDPEPVQVLQNGFDSVLFQHRPEFNDPQLVIDALSVPFKIGGRTVTIGVDCKLGGASWKAVK